MKEEEFIKTIVLSGGSLSVNIPKEVVYLLKLKKGDILRIKIRKEGDL